MKNKKCLVLGANGFIGSHLVDHLVDAGFEVIAFDRFSLAPKFRKSPQIKQVVGDIFEADDVSASMKGADYVFHCFSATTPASSDNDPYQDIVSNLLNGVKIFEECTKNNIKKVIFISSGGTIYGEGGKSEDDATLPISPYGISKLALERYLAYFNKKFSLPYMVYRLSNPYGPRQITKHNQGVVPRFLQQIRDGEPISVYGDGTSSRDYIYIEDAASMIVDTFDKDNRYHVYNLGSGKQIALNEIIATIESVCGLKANIQNYPEPDTFIKHASMSTKRLESEFGVKAETDFRTGIQKTISGSSDV